MVTGEGEPRAGRRSNGLSAPAYAVLADCDAHVADALLDRLATAGIAAYAVPFGGSVGSYLEVYPPTTPLVRVWVDATGIDTARAVLGHLAAPPDDDAAWREIVASLQGDSAPGGSPWPAAEDVAVEPAPPESPRPATVPRVIRRAEDDLSAHAARGHIADVAHDADDEHYVPPPPPPAPRLRGATAYAVAAIFAGVALLVVPTLAGDLVSPGLKVLAVLAILGGVATLVVRMREGPPTDTGPDDGAVV